MAVQQDRVQGVTQSGGKMFPIMHSDHTPERKRQAIAIVREMAEDVPQLDLGKKVSIPQDLMVEELSLQTNRGSQLFQQRQKRVQKFILEHPTGYRASSSKMAAGGSHGVAEGDLAGRPDAWLSAEGQENYRTELHVAAAGQGTPPKVPKKTNKVIQMSKALNPEALAPGYSGPLKEVPPEKFNFTAIPKSYCSPWQEFLFSEDYRVESKSQLPELPRKPSHLELRSFNRSLDEGQLIEAQSIGDECCEDLRETETPTPFGGVLLNDMFTVPGLEMTAQTDTPNSLELVWNRPSFNRAPQGWVRILPETEEL
ncbi:Myozenin-3 [Chelonia mydas]|uniref:Myozenin-3 n=1 Tax=Chelonia mydas TaxID=8469 RepID=M7AI60_CHEMY|nr:Myozenin-3 [Chelonia mydas]